MYQSPGQCADARESFERITGDGQCNGRQFFDLAAGQTEK